MPYDPKLDEPVFKEMKEFEGTRVTVGVYSYNGGEKKLQLSRENSNANEEWRFAKLGRMSKKELGEILPLMSKALENM
jgi:nuclear transport factor 2 (NTF2) superfamily protein